MPGLRGAAGLIGLLLDVLGSQVFLSRGLVVVLQPRVYERLLNIQVFLLLDVSRLDLLGVVGLLFGLSLLLLDSVLRTCSLAVFSRNLLLRHLLCLGLFDLLLLLLLRLLLHLCILLIGQLNLLLLGSLLSVLSVNEDVADLFGELEIDHVVLNESLDGVSAVVDLGQLNEQRDQVVQLPVLRVIVPRDDRHGLFGHQHVGRRGVVEDHAVFG